MTTIETIGVACEALAYLVLLPALVILPWFM
jgi:hypothetical protein